MYHREQSYGVKVLCLVHIYMVSTSLSHQPLLLHNRDFMHNRGNGGWRARLPFLLVEGRSGDFAIYSWQVGMQLPRDIVTLLYHVVHTYVHMFCRKDWAVAFAVCRMNVCPLCQSMLKSTSNSLGFTIGEIGAGA